MDRPLKQISKEGHRRWRRGLVLLGAFLLCTGLKAAVPQWLQDDSRSVARNPAGEQGAVILRSENVITVTSDGVWQQLYRYAVRIERPNGADFAQMGVPFVEGSDHVLRAEAWLMRDGHLVKSYPLKQWLDKADVDDTTLYSDFRALLIHCPLAARGDVFGGEVLVRQASDPGQWEINFSLPLPALRQRLEIRTPNGWSVKLTWLNGKGTDPSVSSDGKVSVWEIHDQPDEQREVWSSDRPVLLAALTVIPPSGGREAAMPVPATWQEVAASLAKVQRPQCDTNASLAETARRLTAGLANPWKKIQALTTFVQQRRYISVNRNNGLGFGYCPRKATEVLAADYGDCKDKSNLLRALLREAGFRAHLVAAYLGDQEAVQPQWPSAVQFNHAVVAIELPPEVNAPACLDDGVFGRLLFFDSTARWIPVGHLPWLLQGGWGLICDARATGLVKFPRTEMKDEFRLTTRVTLTLNALGECQGEAIETSQGELAAWAQSEEFGASPQQRTSYWLRRLNASIDGVVINSVVSETFADSWGHSTKVKFGAPKFGQPFRSGMLLLNLDVVRPETTPIFPDKPRQHDLLVRPIYMEHEVSLNLRAGTRPEIPAPKELQSEYGRFSGRYELTEGKVIYHRTLVLNACRVPPGKYQDYRRFIADVAKAERTALIVHLAEEQSDLPSVPIVGENGVGEIERPLRLYFEGGPAGK